MERKNNRIRKIMAALETLAIISVVTLAGQSLSHKDLAFPQVAVGPTIETVLCVTNRGDTDYRGTVLFWQGQDRDWNPIVNGVRVVDSILGIVIRPGETQVLRITGDTLTAGAMRIESTDLSLHSFIEGNLSYAIDSPDYDSVGIAPAEGLYLSVVPFESFDHVGLALANPNLERSAWVTMRLFDRAGEEQQSLAQVLGQRSHEAKFLSQIFDARVAGGKVEIESSVPILATAVTLESGEISALPMLASPVRYAFDSDSGLEADQAELVLWSEGVFVNGYLQFLQVDNEPVPNPENYIVTGTLTGGVLRLTQVGAGGSIGHKEPVAVLKLSGFSFQQRSRTGTYTRAVYGFPFDHMIEGTFQLTRLD